MPLRYIPFSIFFGLLLYLTGCAVTEDRREYFYWHKNRDTIAKWYGREGPMRDWGKGSY